DEHSRPPFGGPGMYARSPHVTSIAWMHRLTTWARPGYPLQASAFLVPVLVGTFGVLPAFAIGRRLAGDIGGVYAALLIAINPLSLVRRFGADNDVWTVALPLCLMWTAMCAVEAATVWRQALWAVLGLLVAGLHALTWKGWVFTYAVVLLGLFA